MKVTSFSDFEKNKKGIFIDYKVSGPGSLSSFRAKQYYAYKYDFTGNKKVIIDTIGYFDKALMISLAGLTFEPKFNLRETYSKSFFLKIPVEIGLSLTLPLENFGYYRRVGVFNLGTGLFFGYAKNLNSSFANSNWNGYSVSIGAQYLYGPIVAGYQIQEYLDNSYDYNFKKRKHRIIPVIQFDYYWIKSNKKIRGFSASFSMFPAYMKLAYTFSSKIVNTKKSN
jgi:hypothetical protein